MTYSSFFIWLGAYLLAGVALVFGLRQKASVESPAMTVREFWLELKQAYDDMRLKKISGTAFAEKVLMMPVLLLIWPLTACVAGYMLYMEIKNPSAMLDLEDAFTCKKKHLLDRSTPDKAELLASVIDPKGRVPNLPFGHLNGGWSALLEAMQEGDELWSFEVPGYVPGRQDPPPIHQWAMPKGTRRGYALVAGGTVKADFVYEWD
jgi:hypothetical protein